MSEPDKYTKGRIWAQNVGTVDYSSPEAMAGSSSQLRNQTRSSSTAASDSAAMDIAIRGFIFGPLSTLIVSYLFGQSVLKGQIPLPLKELSLDVSTNQAAWIGGIGFFLLLTILAWRLPWYIFGILLPASFVGVRILLNGQFADYSQGLASMSVHDNLMHLSIIYFVIAGICHARQLK